MSQFLTAFGIDWRLLLINVINFGVLLAGLYYFLYEPLLKILEERRAKVMQGVADAEAASLQLQEIENSKAGVLAQAGHEADEMLKKARAAAAEKERSLVAAAEASAARTTKEAEAQAQELKAQAIAESRQEVAKLVVLGMEKISTTSGVK